MCIALHLLLLSVWVHHCPFIYIVKGLPVTIHAGKCFISNAFVKSAVYLCCVGERCCQGYSTIPAEGTIDDDCINLGQIH